MTAEPDDVRPPSEAFTRQRWLPGHRVAEVYKADAILKEHGAVYGNYIQPNKYRARWRARRLINLMVELRLHERWELCAHVERRGDGYIWAIEYLGGSRK
ncbi:MAG TPA: hypothetical protein VF032_19590 [Thermoleophilaceae bacterium]